MLVQAEVVVNEDAFHSRSPGDIDNRIPLLTRTSLNDGSRCLFIESGPD